MALILLLLGCPEPDCGRGEICTVVGDGSSGWNGEGLLAPDSWLYLPTGLALDPDGRPCVVDFNNFRVRCIDAGRLVTVAGNGQHLYSEPGALLAASPIENPMDIEWSPDGRLTILPVHESRVIRDDGTGRVELVAGTGDEGFAGDGGPAVDANFGQPCGIAYGADGSLWIADTQNGAVRRVGADGIIETVLDDVPGVQRVRPGAGDEMLVVDAFAGRVLAVDAEGSRRVLAEGLSYPWSARLGPDGALYVANSGAHEVLRIEDGQAAAIVGTGVAGFSGDGGPAVDATLSWPSDLLFLPDGRMLISDMQNGRVRSVQY
ncbi:MAG: hypothetical protein EXR71_11045 [Myxococcales bacterium]|nr:hypothetical protein [Myxococcales bacterium]